MFKEINYAGGKWNVESEKGKGVLGGKYLSILIGPIKSQNCPENCIKLQLANRKWRSDRERYDGDNQRTQTG